MGKKYIIELLDDCQSEFKGIMVFGLTQEKQISVELIPEESLKPYTEPDIDAIRKEEYKRGLSDMRDALKRIEKAECVDDLVSLGFDVETASGWSKAIELLFEKYSPSEIIEKIRQYEQTKEKIQVGDEVATDAGNRASVLYENPDGTQVFVFKSDGTAAWWTKSALHRTGRNFPEIAAVLEKMKE